MDPQYQSVINSVVLSLCTSNVRHEVPHDLGTTRLADRVSRHAGISPRKRRAWRGETVFEWLQFLAQRGKRLCDDYSGVGFENAWLFYQTRIQSSLYR